MACPTTWLSVRVTLKFAPDRTPGREAVVDARPAHGALPDGDRGARICAGGGGERVAVVLPLLPGDVHGQRDLRAAGGSAEPRVGRHGEPAVLEESTDQPGTGVRVRRAGDCVAGADGAQPAVAGGMGSALGVAGVDRPGAVQDRRAAGFGSGAVPGVPAAAESQD